METFLDHAIHTMVNRYDTNRLTLLGKRRRRRNDGYPLDEYLSLAQCFMKIQPSNMGINLMEPLDVNNRTRICNCTSQNNSAKSQHRSKQGRIKETETIELGGVLDVAKCLGKQTFSLTRILPKECGAPLGRFESRPTTLSQQKQQSGIPFQIVSFQI